MKNLRISSFILFALLIVMTGFTSCDDTNDVDLQNVDELTLTEDEKSNLIFMREEEKLALQSDSIGYALFQSKCMACHSVTGKTHDELIAPPMIAVKRRYSMMYDERDDFIKHIIDWAKDPKEENAIMRGAVNKFKTMPYLNFEEDELNKIAEYIYENEMEKPDWFDDHFKEMHPNGKMGQGKGSGKNKGKMNKK